MRHGKMVVSCQTGDVNEKYTSLNTRSSVHCHVISSQEDTPDSVISHDYFQLSLRIHVAIPDS